LKHRKRDKETLTEIPISAVVVLARYLGFCLRNNVREFMRSTLCSILDAGYIPIPYQCGPRYPARARTVTKGGRSLRDCEHDTARDIFEYVAILNFVPGRRIQLRQPLEKALRDFRSGTGLESTLHVVISPVYKHLVLYHIPRYIRGAIQRKEETRQTDSVFNDSKGISRALSMTGSKNK
jgi:hypothetical protein